MQTPMAVPTQFSLGDATLFAGYTLGERWNGFACPYFTAQQANTWMAHYNAQYHAEYGIDTVRYDADHDAYVITYPDDPERPADIYAGKDLDTVNGRLHVYPIGAGDWIWSEPVVRQQPSHACALVLIPYLLLGAPEVWIRSYRRDADLADPLTLARVALEDFSGTHDPQEIAVHLKSWRVDRMVLPLEIPAERDDHSPQWHSFWTAAVLDGRLEAIY